MNQGIPDKSQSFPVRSLCIRPYSERISSNLAVEQDGNLETCLRLENGTLIQVRAWDPIIAAQIADSCRRRDTFVLLAGDESEHLQQEVTKHGVNIVRVLVDARNSTVEIRGSMVGLPPVFILRTDHNTVISTPSMPDRSDIAQCAEVDVEGVADTLVWGYPIDGRTLSANVRVLPASSTLLVDQAGGVGELRADEPWFVQSTAGSSEDEQLEAMCEALQRRTSAIPDDKAFASLSGGLDSRVVAVALVAGRKQCGFVSLASGSRSLDARLAAEFCKRHGVKHEILDLQGSFLQTLADRVIKTSALTLGLSALAQSVDHYMYESLGVGVRRRITGNLGNQVGRGGVESLSVHTPHAHLFSNRLQQEIAERAGEPWFISRMQAQGFSRVLFQQEVAFWSIPNYVVGSEFATQSTPYADLNLLRMSAQRLDSLWKPETISRSALKLRDTRHRISGTPKSGSFQRRFVARRDTRAANVPINWGWRAGGGWSMPWLIEASKTMIDAACNKWSGSRGVKGLIARNAPGSIRVPFALVDWHEALNIRLRDLTNDILRSQCVRTSDVFNHPQLLGALDRYFGGDGRYQSDVAKSLEIGLAISHGK